MKVINARNVHEALPLAMKLLHSEGSEQNSRNGKVLSMGPVATVYHVPEERVILHPWRDANPFFHFYESLWMLAGRNDVRPLTRYVKRMASFSDDGETFSAAYGWRWGNQLPIIIETLKANHNDRRCVLQMWDRRYDLGSASKDVACNVAATFQISGGRLEMVVFCRSNDIIWGCYGANAVHFSMLMEYVARNIGVPMGTYTQVSVNWHAYRETFDPIIADALAEVNQENENPYSSIVLFPLMSTDRESWDKDVRAFVTVDGRAPRGTFADPFFHDVALPIVHAHDIYKDNDEDRFLAAIETLDHCKAADWREACIQWILRKQEKYIRAKDGGVTP